jgi:hypothetical protein
MIAGEHQNLDMAETRRAPALPQAEPRHRLLQAPEAARRLGQRRFAAGDRSGGFGVAAGQIEASGMKIGK